MAHQLTDELIDLSADGTEGQLSTQVRVSETVLGSGEMEEKVVEGDAANPANDELPREASPGRLSPRESRYSLQGSRESLRGSRRSLNSSRESLNGGGLSEEARMTLELRKLEAEERQREKDREAEERQRDKDRESEERKWQMQKDAEERREKKRDEDKKRESAAQRDAQTTLELRKLQDAKEAREAEDRREMRRLQLEEEKVRKGLPVSRDVEGGEEKAMARSLQLLPDFDEERVNEWFTRFEKKAYEFSWPEERWVGLVAHKLKGKAAETYDAMSVRDLHDYAQFKADILRAYELRPEAYRLRFRGGKKKSSESYQDCARYLEQAFERWVASEGVESLEEFKELTVMEQFINVADKELVPLLREKRFKTLREAAIWADDHVLAHRQPVQASGWFKKEGGGGPRGPGGSGGSAPTGSSGGARRHSQHFGGNRFTSGKSQAPTPSSSAKEGQAGKATPGTPKHDPYDNRPTCYFCRGKGHFRNNCPRLVPVSSPSKTTPQKHVALLVWPNQGPDQSLIAPLRPPVSKENPKPRSVSDLREGQTDSPALALPPTPPTATATACPVTHDLDWCRPFLCAGSVEIAGNTYPVTVLRDTGAQQ